MTALTPSPSAELSTDRHVPCDDHPACSPAVKLVARTQSDDGGEQNGVTRC